MTEIEKARRDLRNALRSTLTLLEEDGRDFGWLESILASKLAIDRAFSALNDEASTPPNALDAWAPLRSVHDDEEGNDEDGEL